MGVVVNIYDDSVCSSLVSSQICVDSDGEAAWVLVDDGVEYVEDMMNIISCVRGVIEGLDYRDGKYKRDRLNYFGKIILSDLKIDSKGVIEYFNGNLISPYLRVFDDARDKLKEDVDLWLSVIYDGFCDVQGYRAVGEFVRYVRESVDEPDFKKYMKNNWRARMKSLASVRHFMDSLCGQVSSLQVVRLKLAYSSKFLHSSGVSYEVESVKRDFSRFIKGVSGRYGKESCFGYVWKLGFSSGRYLSYDFFLFLDGSKFMDGSLVAAELGEFWRDIVTMGGGTCLSYNERANCSKAGIFGVGGESTLRVQNLYFDLYSLVKLDSLIKPNLIGIGRTFGRSGIRGGF